METTKEYIKKINKDLEGFAEQSITENLIRYYAEPDKTIMGYEIKHLEQLGLGFMAVKYDEEKKRVYVLLHLPST